MHHNTKGTHVVWACLRYGNLNHVGPSGLLLEKEIQKTHLSACVCLCFWSTSSVLASFSVAILAVGVDSEHTFLTSWGGSVYVSLKLATHFPWRRQKAGLGVGCAKCIRPPSFLGKTNCTFLDLNTTLSSWEWEGRGIQASRSGSTQSNACKHLVGLVCFLWHDWKRWNTKGMKEAFQQRLLNCTFSFHCTSTVLCEPCWNVS